MQHEYDKRLMMLEKIQARQSKQLNRIEKYLNNHLAHQKIVIDRWMKIIIPSIVALSPILVAFANSDVLVKLIDFTAKALGLK